MGRRAFLEPHYFVSFLFSFLPTLLSAQYQPVCLLLEPERLHHIDTLHSESASMKLSGFVLPVLLTVSGTQAEYVIPAFITLVIPHPEQNDLRHSLQPFHVSSLLCIHIPTS